MDKKRLPRKQPNAFLKYSNLAIQMGLVIGLFSWLGMYLDKKYDTPDPYFTIVLSLTGIGASLYLVIKEVISSQRDKDEN